MAKEQGDLYSPTNQARSELGLSIDRDYHGLKIVQAQALNLFNYFMSENRLMPVIQRYVGPECYSRNQTFLDSHHRRLEIIFGNWNGKNRDDLFYPLFEIDKAELIAEPSDTFLTGRALGEELFAVGKLDHVVGFSTAAYSDFQRDTTNYLVQQLCRVYFINPEVRVRTAVLRRLADEDNRKLARQQLDQGRLTRGLLPYSQEDLQTVISLYLAGEPIKVIGDAVGRTAPAIQFQVAKLELPPRRDLRPWTSEEVTDLLRLKQERRFSNDQIAEVLNRTERAVHNKLVEKGSVSFHRKPWEPEEFQRFQELLASVYSWATVIQKLSKDFPRGRTAQYLRAKAHLSRLRIKTEFELKKAEFEQLLAEGLTERIIAEKLGIHPGTVNKWKRRLKTRN